MVGKQETLTFQFRTGASGLIQPLHRPRKVAFEGRELACEGYLAQLVAGRQVLTLKVVPGK